MNPTDRGLAPCVQTFTWKGRTYHAGKIFCRPDSDVVLQNPEFFVGTSGRATPATGERSQPARRWTGASPTPGTRWRASAMRASGRRTGA
jgi:hypothetical protein